ncbi:predicted protein [Uncinocarpus reesii 1704]|uniref:Uncharacterized protein n=1 Tax=Uncinocarpus reesii (strain UAMH 1704) TaxID=336963 RepID=C4JGR0_UNCRE|nr:uncharacterized protein UREG_02572 [Uncinocarpus reesii 1704]EEP77723.1 predicted protein [Uncinocarpus reesii 1704]
MSAGNLRPSSLRSFWNRTFSYSARRALADLHQGPPEAQFSANHEPAPRREGLSDKLAAGYPEKAPKIGYDPERITQERSILSERFELPDIPATYTDLGVEIDAIGQLKITDPVASRREHKTALVFSAAPISLVERDFRKLLDPGKLIEGWRTDGGLEKIIPSRDLQTLRRKHGWVLVFKSPAAAQEYQARVHNLRNLLRQNLPLSSDSKLQLPPAYTTHGSRGFTLQDYTLSSPALFPSVIAHLAPFKKHIKDLIKLHHNINTRNPGEEQSYGVQISLDTRYLSRLETEHIAQFLRYDSENRKLQWKLANVANPILPLTGESHTVLDRVESAVQSAKGLSSWRVLFENPSEARRFVRAWHRRPWPRFESLPRSEPPSLMHVECLFQGEGF